MARYKFNFWLDANKHDELLVAERVDELKRKRSFSSVLRDGIMIVSELREGKIDLLLKLYPWIADAVRPPADTPNSGDLKDIKAELARMQQFLLQQSSGTPSGMVMKPDVVAPTLETKVAPLADAEAIANNFLAFLQ
jgi:hypothetical protein